MKLKIVGLRVEKFINKFVSGHNCDFTYYPAEDEKYTIFVRDVDRPSCKYAIRLKNEYGECGSGWCTASWGSCVVEYLYDSEPFGPFNYIPIDDGIFEAEIDWNHGNPILRSNTDGDYDPDFKCDYFSWDEVGGDGYYPSGGVFVNLEKFKELPRGMKKRPVWIFYGDSGLGKSTLAKDLTEERQIYETDSSETLPDEIVADIVVIGNKYKFTIDEVKQHLFGDPMVIPVEFKTLSKEDS